MKVLHVIPSLSPVHGGPSFVLPVMARALADRGIEVDVACTDDDGPGRRLAGIPLEVAVQRDGFRVFYFPKQTDFYKVSLPLMTWLEEHVSEYDVVHVHAVFSFSTIAAGRAARRHGVPYIVRPLGVLNRWGMEQRRRWIKQWSFRLLDRPVLRRAACIHYTSGQEEQEAARLDLRVRGAVIPLGISMEPFDKPSSPRLFHESYPECRESRNVLFMSRLDRKKGVELLLEAFAEAHPRFPASRLVIAGDGDSAYVAGLRQLAERLGISSHITWTGFLEGTLKLSALSAASLFVLPSYSENFGIVLLEAMAAGLPCIASDQVALAVDVASHDAVEIVSCDSSTVARAIVKGLDQPAESQAMGQRAAALARRSYSLQAMAAALEELYNQSIRDFSQS